MYDEYIVIKVLQTHISNEENKIKRANDVLHCASSGVSHSLTSQKIMLVPLLNGEITEKISLL